MICCALLALVFATAAAALRAMRPRGATARGRALAWRPYPDPPAAVGKVREGPGLRFSLRQRLASFRFAFAGLRRLLATEHNARIHLAAATLAAGFGVALGIDAEDWRWIIAAILWVWVAEALNTALEHLCDAVSPEPHPAIGAAKDVAAGAVLLGAVGAAIIGAITFASYLSAPRPDGICLVEFIDLLLAEPAADTTG